VTVPIRADRSGDLFSALFKSHIPEYNLGVSGNSFGGVDTGICRLYLWTALGLRA
jgi:hypothetical protein